MSQKKTITNFDKLKEINTINDFAALISGKYACTYCAFKGEEHEESYMENSCIDGIKIFLKKEYKKGTK